MARVCSRAFKNDINTLLLFSILLYKCRGANANFSILKWRMHVMVTMKTPVPFYSTLIHDTRKIDWTKYEKERKKTIESI